MLRVKKDGVEEVWKGDEILSSHFATPVYYRGYLYGFDGRQEEGPRLRCVEWKTGKVRWAKEGFGCGFLIVADGMLIVLSEGGELVLVEPAEWEICCGSAGIYNLIQPEPAAELGRRKAGNLLATGAEAIAAANPGCALQIAAHLGAAGRPLPVYHPVELLAASIEGRMPQG